MLEVTNICVSIAMLIILLDAYTTHRRYVSMHRRVRGSQESVPYIEVGKTDVYIRTNVDRVEEEDFSGWEYDERIISIPEHINNLASHEDLDTTAFVVTILMMELDELRGRIEVLEAGV